MYRAPIDKITRPGIVTHSAVVGTRQGQRVYCGTHQGPCAFETVAKILTAVLVIFVVVLSSRERFRAATALCACSRLSASVCLSVPTAACTRTVSRMAPKKEHSAANLLGAGGAIERHGMGTAIASTPTKEMRLQLKKVGHELPDQDALYELSEKMNVWLEEDRELHGRGQVVTWFNRKPQLLQRKRLPHTSNTYKYALCVLRDNSVCRS